MVWLNLADGYKLDAAIAAVKAEFGDSESYLKKALASFKKTASYTNLKARIGFQDTEVD